MADKVVLRDLPSSLRNPEYVQVTGEPSGDNVISIELQYPSLFNQDNSWSKREYNTRCSIEGPSSTQYFAGHLRFVESVLRSIPMQMRFMGDSTRPVGAVLANLSCIQITKEDFDVPLSEYTFPTI